MIDENGSGSETMLRHCGAEECARIVQEIFTSKDAVGEVARRQGVSRSQSSRWP